MINPAKLIIKDAKTKCGDLKMQSILKLTHEIPLIMAVGTLIAAVVFVSAIIAFVRLIEKNLK